MCGFGKHAGSLLLTLCIDDLGPPCSLGFGLLCDRTNHAFIKVNVFDFDIGDLDTPVVRSLVKNSLDVLVQAFALGEHVVQFMLTQNRAQSCL